MSGFFAPQRDPLRHAHGYLRNSRNGLLASAVCNAHDDSRPHHEISTQSAGGRAWVPARRQGRETQTRLPLSQVEALVASGIAAGWGGGNYCPDAPLTRGQMAVLLSKGLGLHVAP